MYSALRPKAKEKEKEEIKTLEDIQKEILKKVMEKVEKLLLILNVSFATDLVILKEIAILKRKMSQEFAKKQGRQGKQKKKKKKSQYDNNRNRQK